MYSASGLPHSGTDCVSSSEMEEEASERFLLPHALVQGVKGELLQSWGMSTL